MSPSLVAFLYGLAAVVTFNLLCGVAILLLVLLTNTADADEQQ